ncbi:protein maelstrom homolog [Hydractinia symbiolongicarpus]|uniref:protein maelstrom homolog n=1 Tax=Hydractinia symbiolongicarpus TaxID=13093 RepID=UPI00254D5DCC|nr:protein maelstrom homolog [Hydractinia symbiolongicarpus]
MPSKKNQKGKPNGYLLYANEIKNKLLQEGHSIRSTQDLIDAAASKWQNLSPEEKEYYKEKAKWEWENRHAAGSNIVRYTCHDRSGIRNESKVDMSKVCADNRKRERQEVFMSWTSKEELLKTKFYFVSFVCLLEEPQYQPIEVSVVQFSLLHGIKKSWHKFINPGQIPLGYRYKAQQFSEENHKIPVEGLAGPGDTYTKVFDELHHFLSGGTRLIPPIFAKASETEKTEKCIKWLAQNAGRPNNLKRIYELEGLILDLDAYLRKQPQNFNASKQIATDLISSTIFDWDAGTRCKWHEENESKFCALGNVKRYCFCVANYFCEHFNVDVTENHLPAKGELCYTLIPSRSTSKGKSKVAQNGKSDRHEFLAETVMEKLKINADSVVEGEETQDNQSRQEDEVKRWRSLRGYENGNVSNPAVHQDDQLQRNSASRDGKPNTKLSIGRGRARVLVASLRRPGQQPEGAPKNSIKETVSSGNACTALEQGTAGDTSPTTNFNNDLNHYACSAPPPHPSQAPPPPSEWRTD